MAGVTAPSPDPGALTDAPERLSWAAATFSAFRFRQYRTIWLGAFLAFLAVNMSATAQGFVAYDLTGSNSAVGSVMLGQGIAMTFLSPFGGAISDRFPKRLLILFAQVVIGSVSLTIAVLLTVGQLNILFLALGSFTTGAMFSVLGPARTALVGEVVSPERIGNAMALTQVGNNFARIAGPSLASAFLLMVGSAGTYYIIASIFVLVIATYYQIPKAREAAAKRYTNVLQDMRRGVGYVRRNPRLTHTIVSFYLVTMFGMSYIVLMPAFALDVLHAGTAGLGVMLASAAAGGFAMSIVAASLADSKRSSLVLTIASLCAGSGLILTGFAPSLPVAALTMVLASGGASMFQTLNNASAMRITDQAFYGRIISLMMIAWGLNNFVTLPVGLYADFAGERLAFMTLGCILCGVVLLLSLWERRLGTDSPPGAPA